MKIKSILKRSLLGTKRSNAIGLILLSLFIITYRHPELFGFPHHYQGKNLEIYSDVTIENPDTFIENILKRVGHSSLYNSEQKFRVYISDTFGKYRFIDPFLGGSFARYNPMFGNIYVNKTDQNLKVHHTTDAVTRNLEDIITHEITHRILHYRKGMLIYLLLPEWINEGYCDYISNSSTLTEDQANKLLLEKNEKNLSLKYFLYRKTIERLMGRLGSIDTIIKADLEWKSEKKITINSLLQ